MAAWRSQLWTDEVWKLFQSEILPLFEIPGTSIDEVYFDLMHTKHLGCDAYVLGSFFAYMTSVKGVRLSHLWGQILRCYEETSMESH
eukprot:3563488-Amphidinium_carterae.1